MLNNANIINMLKAISEIMISNKERLIEMDGIFGDSDLGLTMSDGFTAAYNSIKDSEEADIGRLLYTAGKAMSSKVPSTMGTLMASGLMNSGKALKSTKEIELSELTLLTTSFLEGVMKLGKAVRGEKTFIDGFAPAIDSLNDSLANNQDMKTAVQFASEASNKGYEQTKGMLAVHGRAAIRGEVSRSQTDPGAFVATLIIKAISNYINSI